MKKAFKRKQVSVREPSAEALFTKSAAKLMTNNVPVVSIDSVISDAEKILFEKGAALETINYIYIVDRHNRLVGVMSVKEIFRRPTNEAVSKIMTTELVSVRPQSHRERVAMLAVKHNLKAIPVVDENSHFLGVVPSDVILNILHQENIEDFLRSAGIHKFKDPGKELITAPALLHFKKRLPWLIFGLFGGLIAASIVDFFEQVLQRMLILAAFIPAVVYMADAVGTQTETIFIRSLAIDYKLNIRRYMRRELAVGLALAAALSAAISLFSFIGWQSAPLMIILGASFFVTTLTAAITAIALPWVFHKLKYDPAMATGPLATVILDILSIIIYFSIASAALNVFSPL